MNINDDEDICLWPDGIWCFRDEVHEFTHKSDDYEIVKFNSTKWKELVR